MRRLNLEGQQFGRLTLLEVVGVDKSKQRVWLCKCECGNTHTASQGHITKGKTTSCGCFRKEKATTHGMHKSPEWFAYQHAKSRCKPDHENHCDYFDRGITFEFDCFEDFFKEVGIRPSKRYSLDRIDNDRGYVIGNIRWATRKQQMRNTRCDNCEQLKHKIKQLEAKLSLTP